MCKEMKHLYRSGKNKIFCGIIGGIGEYFNVDPVLLRVIFVVLLILTGIVPLAVVYLISYFIIPSAPAQPAVQAQKPPDATDNPAC